MRSDERDAKAVNVRDAKAVEVRDATHAVSRSTRPDPRGIAASVIERVLSDAAYAAAALSSAIERYPQLDEGARALLTELVYTTLRTKPSLIAALSAHAPKGLPKDAGFLSHLLVAAAQILYLDRQTAPIVVDVAVSQIDASRGPRMAGFANAVLRKLVAERPVFDRAEAQRQNWPSWLRERLVQAVGNDEAERLLGVIDDANATHPVTLRLRATRPVPEWLAQAETARYSPLARKVTRGGDPRKLPGYDAGDFVIQEEGAQLIALAVAAQSGERILDACAGRGQKTSLLAEQVGPHGSVCATDIHPRKLEALQVELDRLGLSGVTTTAVDWSRGSGGITELFDAALVDAPCTGTGTLRRRPEIAMRLEPGDPARLASLASTILRNVAMCVRPGGRIVYAVCSVLPEEGEGVIEAVADILEPAPFNIPELEKAFGSGASTGRLLPGRHGTDGYFVANLRRR
ncbi:MAG TPA: RsmB/NOP family class I SAM-dependent RNA methyltransferase [Polyangiaceae bacterium]|nr:RsmB/NOP family class I SAM-dependent RNA methyltransferase [Polyangiaceae bacterium]